MPGRKRTATSRRPASAPTMKRPAAVRCVATQTVEVLVAEPFEPSPCMCHGDDDDGSTPSTPTPIPCIDDPHPNPRVFNCIPSTPPEREFPAPVVIDGMLDIHWDHFCPLYVANKNPSYNVGAAACGDCFRGKRNWAGTPHGWRKQSEHTPWRCSNKIHRTRYCNHLRMYDIWELYTVNRCKSCFRYAPNDDVPMENEVR